VVVAGRDAAKLAGRGAEAIAGDGSAPSRPT